MSTSGAAEHFDVVIAGAGLSGIGAGHYIQSQCPWASFAIFEARDAIGGTWDLFRYPGVRSDSDMYTLGYSFRPWPGEKAIADGWSILDYIKDTAESGGIDKHIRFGHRVVKADWSTEQSCWRITLERVDDGSQIEVTADFFFSCTGYYRYDKGYMPDFPGLAQFEGTVVHPQTWPEDLDYEAKLVVVIGSGATAVTLVPSLAQKAQHVTMLQRSPSYIISMPAKNPLPGILKRLLPGHLGPDAVRWFNALVTQGFFHLSRRRPKLVKRILLRAVARQLPKGFDVTKHFTPHYNPWDQRLCAVPDGDLFKAISSGAASVVTDHIDTFTPKGILLRSGAEIEADIIVTATGLELLFLGGVELRVDDAPVDVTTRFVYKGMALEGVPNLAFAVGYTNASWTLKCDLTCQYVARLLNHMRSSGVRQCTAVNRDASVESTPIFGLTSGYVLRSADKFPKQGEKFPWRVYQSYIRDYRALRVSPIDDGVMVFSSPVHDAVERIGAA
ncbi:MAG: flavin-containing monooxygenase [Acidimicrobiales bacterium]